MDVLGHLHYDKLSDYEFCYENEVQLITKVNKLQNKNLFETEFRKILHLFSKTSPLVFIKRSEKKSSKLRKEANNILHGKNKDKLINATYMYTDAILTAPPGIILALAHANRSLALFKFGYFQQAYDDCVVALEQGCPENLKHKIIYRQACCALKIGDLELVTRHLDELEKININDKYMQKVIKMRLALYCMVPNETQQTQNESIKQDFPFIIHKTEGLVATRTIKKNEFICKERAPCVVNGDAQPVCANCLTALLIPFPCKNCLNGVIYCSLKCLHEDRSVHEIECAAIRLNIFIQNSNMQLALRMMLYGMPQILPLLHKQNDIKQLWEDLTSGNVLKTDYGRILQMATPFDKFSLREALKNTQTANFFLYYLKKKTNFFDRLKDVNWSIRKKELLISSLLLRHIGQVKVNAFELNVLTPLPTGSFYILLDNIWTRPFHIKRGKMHSFSYNEQTSVVIFPVMISANHACDPSFTHRFYGRYISAYAEKDIAPGENLTSNYKRSVLVKTMELPRQRFPFECLSGACDSALPQKFNQYHKFRCEYNDCRKVFIAKYYEYNYDLICDCGRKQTKDWIDKFNNLLPRAKNPSVRRRLFTLLKKIYNYRVMNFNINKLNLGRSMIIVCWKLIDDGVPFPDNEYNMIGDLILFNMECLERLEGATSNPYISEMFSLWDLIALGKYKYEYAESFVQKMMQAIESLADDIKCICKNYFEEFVKPQLKYI